MQRRKGLAHISPPPSSPSSSMSDEKAPSRLNQRHLGVKARIWLILFLFVAVVSITHYIIPETQTYTPYSTVNLKSKNYLNNTDAEPNPFDFCPVYGPGDAVGAKYGALTLSQSRLHLGSSARVSRVINRALAGQPVTISVLGGSGKCSACLLTPFSIFCQFLRVMAPETILSLRAAIRRDSSNGGIPSFPTPPRSSQTAP